MLMKSKFALVAAIALASIASPAFAQSVDHTGNLFPSYYDGNGKQVLGAAPQAVASRHQPAEIGRGLYNTAAPSAVWGYSPAVSGYDGSIATQR
jgi:hypothetical protein